MRCAFQVLKKDREDSKFSKQKTAKTALFIHSRGAGFKFSKDRKAIIFTKILHARA
jgi:hypothetical protein